MRVHKAGTDCIADISVFANGRKCPEFVLPNAEDGPAGSVCFVPVTDDSMITIQGTFTGTILKGRVDLLADGSYVACRHMESPEEEEGALHYFSERRVEIKTFMHVPDLSDHEYKRKPKVVEGTLTTKRLSRKDQSKPLNGGPDKHSVGVGCLTLIVSLTQKADEIHGKDESKSGAYYEQATLGSWRDSVLDVKDSRIKPEHELAMEVFTDSNPVKDKKARTFWREKNEAREGSNQPWAFMIFYYRTQDAIDAAGCMPLTESRALAPHLDPFKSLDPNFVPLSPATILRELPRMPTDQSSSPPLAPKKRLGLGQPLLLLEQGKGKASSEKQPRDSTQSGPSSPATSNRKDTKTITSKAQTARSPTDLGFSLAPRAVSPLTRDAMETHSAQDSTNSKGSNARPAAPSSLATRLSSTLKPSPVKPRKASNSAQSNMDDSAFDDLVRPSQFAARVTIRPDQVSPLAPTQSGMEAKHAFPHSQSLFGGNTTGNLSTGDDTPSDACDISSTAPAKPSLNTAAKHPATTNQAAAPFQVPAKRSFEAPAQEPPRSLPEKPAESSAKPSPEASPQTVAKASPELASQPPVKRQRLEDIAAKKARIEAALKAKRERKLASQQQSESETRMREEQQRKWAEEQALRRQREDEERRKEEEEEAAREEEAIRALEEELAAEDEETAMLEEQIKKQRRDREELEAVMKRTREEWERPRE